MTKAAFKGHCTILGFGSIGKCILPMIQQELQLSSDRIRVVDALPLGSVDPIGLCSNVQFTHAQISPANLAEVLARTVVPGDILLNLSIGVSSIALADWCHAHGVIYVDTSLEPWAEYVAHFDRVPRPERTLHWRKNEFRHYARIHWKRNGPTIIVNHGANPGLVSHFTKAAILDLARAIGIRSYNPQGRTSWARLAMRCGVRVVHISEKDTQFSWRRKQLGEFVNTWSIEGLIGEAISPAEFGWGTHEEALPVGGRIQTTGELQTMYMERNGGLVKLRSWLPKSGAITGLALPHDESLTISEFLTYGRDGSAVYRPTVAFVYGACDDATCSIDEYLTGNLSTPMRERILNQDIVEGRDELGVLLLGNESVGWWFGSQLDIDCARRLVPGNNATAVQVAAGAVAAVSWAVKHPNRGLWEPDWLPYDEILAIARPYIEPVKSISTQWRPAKARAGVNAVLSAADVWQFNRFQHDT